MYIYHLSKVVLQVLFFLYKVLWDSPKRDPLPIVAAKLESTAQCGTVPVPPITGPPKISKSWLIRGRDTVPWKNERDSGREKKSPCTLNYKPHWPHSRTSLGKGRPKLGGLHLKLNLAKLHKQEVSPKTHTALWKPRRPT